MPVPTEANRDQAALWNDVSGPTWVEMQGVLDRMLAPFADTLIETVRPAEGERVLDVGCGAGATTLAVAEGVGVAGHALGVDISAPLVAAAKARAEKDGLAAADFICADAQTHAFEPGAFDAVISRFGVMFFDDPIAAFQNLRRAARLGGRLAFVAWRAPSENPFMIAAARAAAPFLPAAAPPAPDAPGQFAFADGARVQAILEAAGWSAVDVAPLDLPGVVPEADLMAYVTRLGPAGIALRSADESLRTRVTEALRTAFEPYVHDGAARFTSACWRVTARA